MKVLPKIKLPEDDLKMTCTSTGSFFLTLHWSLLQFWQMMQSNICVGAAFFTCFGHEQSE